MTRSTRYHTLFPALTALVLSVPTLAASEEDRQDTRLGQEAWETRFIGQYGSKGGACNNPEDVWVLSALSVDAGPVRCQNIGKMTWSDDGLVVPLSQCRDGSEQVDDRDITFADTGETTLTALTGEETVELTRCD